MKSPESAALFAARWVDQRLREIVLHWQPTMEAISDAHRGIAKATATDPRDFVGKREVLAGEVARSRGDMLRDAARLLELRRAITPPSGAFPQEPPEVMAELRRLQRIHDAYLKERYAAEEWFDNAFEYSLERDRCEHDGDVMPNPADYGLDPSEYLVAEPPAEEAE